MTIGARFRFSKARGFAFVVAPQNDIPQGL